MSNRAIFAIMAAVAVVALVGLWLLVKSDGDDAQASKGSGSAAPSAWGGSAHGPANGKPLGPALPSPRDPPGTKPGEYASNGAIVRDHRTGEHPVFEPNANPAPVNNRRLQPTLTKAIADRVRDVMHECVKSLPSEARGEKPRLEGSINIAIKSNKVVVNTAELNVKDVNGAAAETTKQCIVGKSMAITEPATDEPDLDSYDINLSFTLI